MLDKTKYRATSPTSRTKYHGEKISVDEVYQMFDNYFEKHYDGIDTALEIKQETFTLLQPFKFKNVFNRTEKDRKLMQWYIDQLYDLMYNYLIDMSDDADSDMKKIKAHCGPLDDYLPLVLTFNI